VWFMELSQRGGHKKISCLCTVWMRPWSVYQLHWTHVPGRNSPATDLESLYWVKSAFALQNGHFKFELGQIALKRLSIGQFVTTIL
jgi:hypothetical protein